MSPNELAAIIKKQEELGLSNAVLSVTKPKSFKLRGYRLRTAFGLCEVYNMREYEDRNEFTVCCDLKAMKVVLQKLKDEMMSI